MNSNPAWNDFRTRWPNTACSRFVDAAGLRWHVQTAGTGPVVVLLHGSGAATHSWRDVLPDLAQQFTVIAPDLPGHGFTTRPDADGMSLAGMAAAVRELLRTLDVQPQALAGHSAGGALALWLASNWPTSAIVGVNAALSPPSTIMSLLTPAVQSLTRSGIAGFLTAKLAESDFVFDSLMRSTGSTISREQTSLYRALATSSQHATAVMSMFAGWDLPALARKLPQIDNPVTLVIGMNDAWVPPAETVRTARLLPNARIIEIAGAGHLAHEEVPNRVADIIRAAVPRPS